MSTQQRPTRDRVLDAVREHGPCPQHELADVLGLSAPTISTHLSTLEAEEKVTRRITIGYAREKTVDVTEDGQ